jgi:hypothetical protein
MNGILNVDLVKRAFEIVRPAIEVTLRDDVTDRPAIAIVVAATDGIQPPQAQGGDFKSRCLLVTAIGDLSQSAYPNLDIALKKAEMSARTGLPTAGLPPQHFHAGDTFYWGSAVLDGIVVACAGLASRHDEMFAYWIAATVQAEAREALQQRISSANGASFLA